VLSLIRHAYSALGRRTGGAPDRDQYGWFGNYASWEAARAETTGYDADIIPQRALESALKIKRGAGGYERDSVVFADQAYVWPTLSALLMCSAACGGRLRLVDFGGAFGSTYTQYRRLWPLLNGPVEWTVVEQTSYIIMGRQHIGNDILTFEETVGAALNKRAADVLLLSSVIQYFEHPYGLLEDLMAFPFQFIIIDRTGFAAAGVDRLTVQRVHPSIYPASYPCWFLSKPKMLALIQKSYDLVFEFPAIDRARMIPSEYCGFLFKRRP
jgi:putative methyltransferase (TIGR04325 family)